MGTYSQERLDCLEAKIRELSLEAEYHRKHISDYWQRQPFYLSIHARVPLDGTGEEDDPRAGSYMAPDGRDRAPARTKPKESKGPTEPIWYLPCETTRSIPYDLREKDR
jgi:hypothetical protein